MCVDMGRGGVHNFGKGGGSRKGGFTIKGVHKKGVHVNPVNPLATGLHMCVGDDASKRYRCPLSPIWACRPGHAYRMLVLIGLGLDYYIFKCVDFYFSYFLYHFLINPPHSFANANTTPTTGHSCLHDPGQEPHKDKDKDCSRDCTVLLTRECSSLGCCGCGYLGIWLCWLFGGLVFSGVEVHEHVWLPPLRGASISGFFL